MTGSLFARLDDLPDVKYLLGSRKFIEAWSSLRVSSLGLLQIGRNAGTKVIQLFGCGVRLAGVGGQLKRASHVRQLGPHPAGIGLGETLYACGVKAPPLQDSEARLAWDVRRVWERLHKQALCKGTEVELLRNLAGVGVGLFAAEGFLPDFLMRLARGRHQVLAFVEPKGLRLQWPRDKFDLLETVVPNWGFSVPVRGYVLSPNTQAEIDRIQPGFSWDNAPAVLLHQDAHGDHAECLLPQWAAMWPPAA